ncbi:hypothetical protein PMIN06_001992 [Paraphaeosphaeria minitans]
MEARNSERISDCVIDTANSLGPETLISPVSNGTRKISASLLSPPDLPYASSPSSSTTTAAMQLEAESLEIPESLYTAEELAWCGFNIETAQLLIDKFLESSTEDTLDVFLSHHIRTFQFDDDDEDHDWTAAMKKIGISDDLRIRILNPQFSDIRCTQPLRVWLEEFITSNVLTMRLMDENLKDKLEHLRKPQSMLREGAGAEEERSKFKIARLGYDTLYRATTTERLKNVFLETGVTLENCMQHVAFSQPPNDFGWAGYGTMFYFTKQDFVAQWYAEYAANCIQNKHDVVVLRICSKQQTTQPFNKTWKLEYGDDWRRLVWHSRNSKPFPKQLKEKFSNCDVITGPISINATSTNRRMKDWTEVNESHVFNIRPWGQGGPTVQGTQHVFKWPDVMQDLNEKVDVDLFKCYPVIKRLATPRKWIACRLGNKRQ